MRTRFVSMLLMLMLILAGCAIERAPAPGAQVPSDPAVESAGAELPPEETPAPDDAIGDESQAPASSTWTIGMLGEPATLLPFSPDGRVAAPIVELLFPAPVLSLDYAYTTTGVLEQLPTIDNGGVEIQELSGFLDASGVFTTTETSQPTTTQQLAITYRWNPSLSWADGTPLTAADSVFSYDLFRDLEPSQEAQTIGSLIESYEQVDEHTTRALLKPGQIAPNYLLTAWPPLPQHAIGDNPTAEALAQFKSQPLGYGPYTFAEQQSGSRVVLRRNEFWPGGDQLPDEVVFRFFASGDELRNAVASGDVDIGTIESVAPELFPYLDQDQQSGAAQVSYIAGPIYEHLDFNLAETRLQDIRMRRAIAHAIDRSALIEAFLGSKVQPIHSWILPQQRAFFAGDEQLTRYNFDPDRARALLDELGYRDSDGNGIRELPDGSPLSLSLLTTDTPLRIAMAQQIAQNLGAVGIAVEVQQQPIDQFYSPTGPLYRRTFQMALFAWIASADPGGLPLWSCAAVPSQDNGFTGNNFSGWCYEQAEWALRRANATLDLRQRAQNYLVHQQLWTQEAPVIPLFQRPIAIIAAPNVQGFQPDALAPITWNIEQWRK